MSCNCPKGEELHGIIRNNIEESGFHAFYIFDPEKQGETFFYTIGLSERGLPELFMGIDCKPEIGIAILHNIVSHMTENGISYDRNSDILTGMDIKLAIAEPDYAIDNYLVHLGNYYQTKELPVLQVLMPDKNGNLPDESGYDMPQIILPKVTLN